MSTQIKDNTCIGSVLTLHLACITNQCNMKTSVILHRMSNDISVRQDSKTKFFNANDLVEAYNSREGTNKRLQDFLDNKETKEYMGAILRDLQNNANQREYENGVIQTRRGKNGGTWMHGYLLMDLGMWLSPEWKLFVVKWFWDNLVEFRVACGDGFIEVTNALMMVNREKRTPHYVYSNEADMLNKLVFGRTGKGMRDKATEQQLSVLKALQKADVKLISSGLDYHDRYEKLKEVKNTFLLTC